MDLALLKRLAVIVALVFALIVLLAATGIIGGVPAWMLPAAVLLIAAALAVP